MYSLHSYNVFAKNVFIWGQPAGSKVTTARLITRMFKRGVTCSHYNTHMDKNSGEWGLRPKDTLSCLSATFGKPWWIHFQLLRKGLNALWPTVFRHFNTSMVWISGSCCLPWPCGPNAAFCELRAQAGMYLENHSVGGGCWVDYFIGSGGGQEYKL